MYTNESGTGQERVISMEGASERMEKFPGWTHGAQSTGLDVSLFQTTERLSLTGCLCKLKLWRSDPQILQYWWGGGGAGEERVESRSVGLA